jgi:hypothetical protein
MDGGVRLVYYYYNLRRTRRSASGIADIIVNSGTGEPALFAEVPVYFEVME